MNIRLAHHDELDEILSIFDTARTFMRNHGNLTQWSNGYPSRELLITDIRQKQLFVCEQNGHLCGVFAFILGEDPTYTVIENGSWPNSEPYGTIHRIASNGQQKGVLSAAVNFALQYCSNLRADTHADNTVMQNALLKLHFTYCGIIYVSDGTPRLAYHYIKKAAE